MVFGKISLTASLNTEGTTDWVCIPPTTIGYVLETAGVLKGHTIVILMYIGTTIMVSFVTNCMAKSQNEKWKFARLNYHKSVIQRIYSHWTAILLT